MNQSTKGEVIFLEILTKHYSYNNMSLKSRIKAYEVEQYSAKAEAEERNLATISAYKELMGEDAVVKQGVVTKEDNKVGNE